MSRLEKSAAARVLRLRLRVFFLEYGCDVHFYIPPAAVQAPVYPSTLFLAAIVLLASGIRT